MEVLLYKLKKSTWLSGCTLQKYCEKIHLNSIYVINSYQGLDALLMTIVASKNQVRTQLIHSYDGNRTTLRHCLEDSRNIA